MAFGTDAICVDNTGDVTHSERPLMFFYAKSSNNDTLGEFGLQALLDVVDHMSNVPAESIFHGLITPEDAACFELHTGCSGGLPC